MCEEQTIWRRGFERGDQLTSMTNLVQMSVATPSEQHLALELVFSSLTPELRRRQVAIIQQQANGGLASLDGLLVARGRHGLMGATWVSVFPGRTAAVWPPRTVDRESSQVSAQLLHFADEYLFTHKVRLAQCLLEPDAGPDTFELISAGFEHAADLLYMASSSETFPEGPPVHTLHFERYRPESEQLRLNELLLSTYEGTLDCPALDGIRKPDDVLAGYQATGDSNSNHWYFIRDKIGDVGCLLLSDHPQDDQWELIYVGFVPASRGQGWGLEATRQAQWMTSQAGRQRLVLAVDAANIPALRIYSAAGFAAWDRRSVYLKVFADVAS